MEQLDIFRMTVHNIPTTQIGTHPLLTAPPTSYPLFKAAESASRQIRKGNKN